MLCLAAAFATLGGILANIVAAIWKIVFGS
jgi:hypothetical protein